MWWREVGRGRWRLAPRPSIVGGRCCPPSRQAPHPLLPPATTTHHGKPQHRPPGRPRHQGQGGQHQRGDARIVLERARREQQGPRRGGRALMEVRRWPHGRRVLARARRGDGVSGTAGGHAIGVHSGGGVRSARANWFGQGCSDESWIARPRRCRWTGHGQGPHRRTICGGPRSISSAGRGGRAWARALEKPVGGEARPRIGLDAARSSLHCRRQAVC